MYSTKIDPKFNNNQNPKVGLIALASDYIIDKDFINIIKDKKIDFFVNLSSKSLTVKLNLFFNKLPASFPPTFPNPINPTFISSF